MKTEKEIIDINNKIYKLLMDEEVNYIEAFAILETTKAYYVGKLIQAGADLQVFAVRLKK